MSFTFHFKATPIKHLRSLSNKPMVSKKRVQNTYKVGWVFLWNWLKWTRSVVTSFPKKNFGKFQDLKSFSNRCQSAVQTNVKEEEKKRFIAISEVCINYLNKHENNMWMIIKFDHMKPRQSFAMLNVCFHQKLTSRTRKSRTGRQMQKMK